MLSVLSRLVCGGLVGAAVLVFAPLGAALAHGSADPNLRPVTAAETSIAVLVGPHPADALAIIPHDFARRLGYAPGLLAGRPVNPAGGCSSPIPLPAAFTDACRAHDLGYDLLRYAASTGRPAAPWARAALDRRLVDDMHRMCTDPFCHAAAELAHAGLALNTWRQRSGPPVPESVAEIAVDYLRRALDAVGLR